MLKLTIRCHTNLKFYHNIRFVLFSVILKKGEEKNMSGKMKSRFGLFTSAILAVLFFSSILPVNLDGSNASVVTMMIIRNICRQ